jgi:arginine-tRNA-protein transferase
MKVFFSEYRHDYTSYTFGYTIYGLYETRSDLDTLYENGFLPYTGNLKLEYDLYYKSRGLRIELNKFSDTSENRRVNRKVEHLNIELDITPIESFSDWDAFYRFAAKYSEERIGEDKMPAQRIEYITIRKYLSHILIFTSGDKVIGYVLAVMNEHLFHYWFAFYDTGFLEKSIPLGKWMMWRCIHFAKARGQQHIYLGNGYRETSLYKTRDFKAVAFYDGNKWNSDLAIFHTLCHQDDQLKDLDSIKLADDMNTWIKNQVEQII